MVEHRIKANFESFGVPPKIHVVQGDTGRVFVFDLADVTDPSTASLMCKRPDGTIFSYAGVIDSVYNTATFTLSAEGGAFTQTGIVSAQIVVLADGITRSFKFDIIVEENISGTPTPEEVSFVDGLQAQVDDWIDGAQSQFDDLDDKIDQEAADRHSEIVSATSGKADTDSGTFTAKYGSQNHTWNYYKCGKLVTVWGLLNNGRSMSSNYMEGLPFTPSREQVVHAAYHIVGSSTSTAVAVLNMRLTVDKKIYPEMLVTATNTSSVGVVYDAGAMGSYTMAWYALGNDNEISFSYIAAT